MDGMMKGRLLHDGKRKPVVGTSTPHPTMPKPEKMLDKSEHPMPPQMDGMSKDMD